MSLSRVGELFCKMLKTVKKFFRKNIGEKLSAAVNAVKVITSVSQILLKYFAWRDMYGNLSLMKTRWSCGYRIHGRHVALQCKQ